MADVTLESLIEAIVDRRIAVHLGTVAAKDYSTEPGSWPPGATNRRQARDRIAQVDGHERSGKGPASRWSVSRDAYHAHYSIRAVPPPVTDVSALVKAALDASRFRATRRAS